MVVSGNGERSDAAAVEGVIHGYDLVARMVVPGAGVLFRRLDRPLDGLRAAVCEKNAVHLTGREHLLGGVNGRPVVVEV